MKKAAGCIGAAMCLILLLLVIAHLVSGPPNDATPTPTPTEVYWDVPPTPAPGEVLDGIWGG